MFEWGSRTFVMGILNVTPDSFSGDGIFGEDDWLTAVVRQAKSFVDQGADILDVGGESTRPGSSPVTAAAELRRVVPAITAIRRELNIPLSVDTYRAVVAEAATAANRWTLLFRIPQI